jgi:hypothetical protein
VKRKRLRPVSEKRLAERDERAAVRETTLRRAMFRCQAPGVFGVRCGGPLDVHEIFPRGPNPGSQLDDGQTIALCRRHHDYVTDHPQEAHDAGLRCWSWERSSAQTPAGVTTTESD